MAVSQLSSGGIPAPQPGGTCREEMSREDRCFEEGRASGKKKRDRTERTVRNLKVILATCRGKEAGSSGGPAETCQQVVTVAATILGN